MAIEDSEEGHVVVAWEGVVGDVGVFHVFTPALPLAGGVLVVFVLLPVLSFGGDWFV